MTNEKTTTTTQEQPTAPVAESTATTTEQKPLPSKDTGKRSDQSPKTPKPKSKELGDSGKSNKSKASTAKSSNASHSGSGKSKYHKNQSGQKRNFYNPPQKVLRHLAQQSYYDNFYGNQGHFYTLKQKYKTQLCRHFTESGKCPLDKYCQFAHGPQELRQANDPLPKNFGKTALGAVHSNYKTTPCKFWHGETPGQCKFGDSCSFFHDVAEQRNLIDPLPNLPEGVTLPPMPEKLRMKPRGRNYHGRGNNGNFNPNFVPQGPNQFGQHPTNFLELTNIADIAAIGGFNPTKYLQGPPPPQPFTFTAPQQVFQQAKTEEKEDKIDGAVKAQPVEQPTPIVEAAK